MISPRGELYRRGVVFIISLVWQCGFLTAALGCPYSIRDAGFIVRDPAPYRLTVFVNDRTPSKKQLAQWLMQAADDYLCDSNVEVEVVNLDQQPSHEANPHLDSPARENLPTALLLSPQDDAISLPGLGPDMASKEAVQEVVRSIVVSPKREELTAHIVTHWCVVVLVRGADAVENPRVAQAVTAAKNAVLGTTTEMGQKIANAPYIITLSPGDAAERVLMWSVGLEPGNTAQARVAVLFGMGRRIGPVLSADKISKAILVDTFLLLGRNCTCTMDPRWLLGPATPLVWGEDLQRQVYDELGFDPNSPAVAATLGGVWTSLDTAGSQGGDGGPDAGSTEDRFALPASPGYIEFSVAPQETEAPGATRTDSAPPTIEQRSLRVVLGLILALVLIVLGGSVILLLRRSRTA